ncbi:Predicted ATPase [Algoriphagus alkaliphilus]|uniref:Predicted ATPase n=1 Tax=Algoriphagus alkaliphilus TaxID=279824 RepID=A0A1G5XHN7_9BACT|nr:AAA family ATPase [Algoriphagus alkaliphilus]SDA69474.1 Predicted ATPase [Algoriphagus alkaliphilus]
MKNLHDIPLTEDIPGYVVEEIIKESFPHILYLASRKKDGVQVVLKTLLDQYPKKEHLSSLRREYQIITKLQGEGIIAANALVNFGNGKSAIEMERFGISLEEHSAAFPGQILPLDQFFTLAIPLVKSLGKMHEKGIVHKDLVPRNILIDPHSADFRLIDFSASSELSREHQDVAFLNNIEGSLPYMAPEQTGRMNRDIDYRTDYYTLGISFFQLLTGKLPFNAKDALEWVHCHISKQAPAPVSIDSAIPKMVSAIIEKLMAKNAEDRYQSSFGLALDLEKARENFQNGVNPDAFSLGLSDVSQLFQIPQRLYGRAQELHKLETFFENTSTGSVEFCLVSGYSGVGKSVLVQELGRSIAKKRGYLIHGKFDQFRQNAAYIAIASAFRDLIRQLLGEPKERLDEWNTKISSALDTNGQLIVDLIPELELIIGKQAPVQELSPAETQNRFLILFLNFVKVFATADHPLVIFLDDLQWSDIPTLNLINRLVTAQEQSHLLLIGAYRDNAVDATHPLILTLEEIKKKRNVGILPLQPLTQEAVEQIIMDTLLCDHSRSESLSAVLYEKTGGNPFFTIELLKDLHERGVIVFNLNKGAWDWDLNAVKNVENSDSVIDFLVSGQHRLNESTQHVLQLAACIGATFDLKTLSIIREGSMETTAAELYEAIKSNMVIPLNENYKYVGVAFATTNEEIQDFSESGSDLLNPIYKFQHDRVQQAAYSTIPKEKRQALHLSIGRLILAHTTAKELDEVLVDVVGHLNEGRTLIHDPKERREFSRLNLEAGIKARHSSAYDAALGYLKISFEMLDENSWENDYALMWRLSEELQSCYYLTGDWKNADDWTEVMLKNAKTPVEKGLVLAARTRQYATIGKLPESIKAAYQGLAILGFNFIQVPDSKNVAEEVQLVTENLNGKEVADLINNPEITDEKAKIASQLLMEIFPAAFLSGTGRMFPYLVLKSVNIALKYGNSPETAFAYAGYAMLLSGYFEDPAEGYKYGKLAVNLIEKFDDISLRSRIIYVYTMFVHHWSNHWSSMTTWFQRGIKAGYQSGDLLYLAYSAQDCIIWDPTLDLETASREQRKLLVIVKECEYQDSYDSGTLFLQMQQNFQGLTKSQFTLTDENFDEMECVSGMLERHFMTGIANYHIYKAEIHLFYNDPAGAMPHIKEQEKLMASVMSLPQSVRFQIVAFLVRSMLLSNLELEEQESVVLILHQGLEKMAKWAKTCPENFEHLRLLMEAELSGHAGRISEALNLYEQSIQHANKNGFIRDEALANELTAQFLIRKTLPKASEGYLLASHYLYYRWGAYRKTQEMEKKYQVFRTSSQYNSSSLSRQNLSAPGTMGSDTLNADFLDMSSVFRASQMISGELVLGKLLKATLQILIENAGAKKGFLVEQKDGTLVVLAQNDADHPEEVIPVQVAGKADPSLIPASLINTALRTNKPIVIGNAREQNSFSSDPYIIHQKPLSMMCVPLSTHNQGNVAVYLENNLTHSAFTEDRVKVIKLLAAQAAISIENARIYEQQEKLLKAQQHFVPIQFLKHLGHNDIAKVKLGESVSMDMSVLFSDIRNFTPLVELLTPQSVIELLNEYFNHLGKHISESGGFIDSYSGDEFLALFAVPAQQAVEAGVNMAAALRKFNLESEFKGRPILKMGIGVNTGPLVLGTMGAYDRMQCSVLGDTVNLASRIEQLTKVYGAQFLIGENTFQSLGDPDQFSIRMVDRVAVKGKAQAVSLYEVIDAESPERKEIKEATKGLLHAGMNAYFGRDFALAFEIFSKGTLQDAEDPVFEIFINRSQRYLENPPPEDWMGYESLFSK